MNKNYTCKISHKDGKTTVVIDDCSKESINNLEDKSLLECESNIIDITNSIGRAMIEQAMSSSDTDENQIMLKKSDIDEEVLGYSKGLSTGDYKTSFGDISVQRKTFQTSVGGKTYCFLDEALGIISGSTTWMARAITSKYTKICAAESSDDFLETTKVAVSKTYIQNVLNAVGEDASVWQKSDSTHGFYPKTSPDEVGSLSFGLDGAMMNIRKKGWKEAMVGTIALYDKEGKRLETFYISNAPEKGKKSFIERFIKLTNEAKKFAPNATTIGLADGAKCNWKILNPITDRQILDFYHASEYLSKASDALFPNDDKKRKEWLTKSCHNLKHNNGGAKRLLTEMEKELSEMKNKTKRKKELQITVTYFKNGYKKMCYHKNIKKSMPIGSGITEAGCKVIVKQRMCKSGARWIENNADKVLNLRSIKKSGDQWNQFWSQV